MSVDWPPWIPTYLPDYHIFYFLWSLGKGLDMVRRFTMSQILSPSCKEWLLKLFGNCHLDVTSTFLSIEENFEVDFDMLYGKQLERGLVKIFGFIVGELVYIPWYHGHPHQHTQRPLREQSRDTLNHIVFLSLKLQDIFLSFSGPLHHSACLEKASCA